ncbi:Protein CBR-FRPR-18 [Caenorhabditis briggsae]|uniref:G-protein coupled receptors family 1 profile domain-containing protein n=3 Tax=Caenorhabditis TaxID=6237 RepID=A0AAE9D1F0_CAEBR|nr:Protein CBR-FRPR-18 [Caenorhabditis briggsae]PIC27797.1 hypothetical protein B9Z55_019942 [Caenorhabditis nigoni]ULT90409.1 hypothetical protein L3Y34_008628 [Caenorhabditis briggsae]UMM36192.1 hypothetical protein L5515_008467 [Caenorhabditis briggsae]CAP36348.1 Protein CBR-FRPR-18 [Caenorhabditis briggsae]
MESQQLMACAILVIVLVGIFGNTLSFILFSRPHMRSSSVNVLLCALSFFDFSLLTLSIPIFVIPNLDLWADDRSLSTYMAYILKMIYPINLMMQTCSVYIMVMITLERWVAVCRPLQVRVWCTPRKSRNAILVIIVSAFLYNFVRFFEYRFVATETGAIYEKWLRDPGTHRWYYVGYYTIMYIVTHFLVPFSVMAFANGHVIVAMCKLSQTRQMLTRQQQREQSTTVMLLIVTFVFAICNTLPFLLNVSESIFPTLFQDESTRGLAYWLNDLSNLLVVLNSGTTFIIYFTFSEKYRQTLIFILKNGCCATVSDYNNYTAMSRTASMRISSETGGQIQRQGSRMSNSSRSSDVLLKPIYMQKRSERFSSEYNERTCKHLAPFEDYKLPRLPNEKRKKKLHKMSAVEHRGMPEITITFSEDTPDGEPESPCQPC